MPISISILKNKNLHHFLQIHLVITIACVLISLYFLPQFKALNFIQGQFFVWVSLLSLTFSIYLYFLKKNIALLVSVIVFKWPILIYLIYKMTEKLESAPVYLALGFLPVFLSALTWSFLQKE